MSNEMEYRHQPGEVFETPALLALLADCRTAQRISTTNLPNWAKEEQ
jgi:hypothetical protein